MSSRPSLDAYVICATPRTGSTLLCGMLRSTGIAGRPESYFRRESLETYAEAWGIPLAPGAAIDAGYVRAAIEAGSTANGVFGVRVMRETMSELTDALASGRSELPESELDLLTNAFGRTRFVHLRRTDVVAQAVSWARAEQTHVWHPQEAVTPGGQSPRFDRDLIDRLAGRIEEFEAGWQAWFADLGLTPSEIEYEELAANPIGTARAILDFLDLDLRDGRTIEVRHRRQADDLNSDWIARFRSG